MMEGGGGGGGGGKRRGRSSRRGGEWEEGERIFHSFLHSFHGLRIFGLNW